MLKEKTNDAARKKVDSLARIYLRADWVGAVH